MAIFHVSKIIANVILFISLQSLTDFYGFQEEITKQISIMKNLDLTIDHNKGSTVRDVLKIPKALKDLLHEYGK